MKKSISVFLASFLIVFSFLPVSATVEKEETVTTTSFAEIENTPSITMAINEDLFIVNGKQIKTTAPIAVLGKTYVDLYEVAPFLGISVQWVPDYIGFFKVTTPKTTMDFTLISQWDDLINLNHKFFIKDSRVFVSLRELAEIVGLDIAYTDGIITLGKKTASYSHLYGNIDTLNFDDYIYTTYPRWAQYLINPYQEYSYETMLTNADQLHNMYPELIKTSSIGKSVEGRDLLLIKFGRGPKKIFVCGTHHGREYISTTYLMYAIDRYAYAYRTNSMWGEYNPKEILDKVTFYIVPMVNPDGVNLVQNGIQSTTRAEEIAQMGIYEGAKYGYAAWKANINGVDLNWNYDKDWSPEKTRNGRGSVGFNGDYPNSEPETAAVSAYVDNNSFDAFLSMHTQGEIFYWADDPANPSYIYQSIIKDTGFIPYYDDGTGIGGSFFDYVYRKFNKPTITIELCPYIGNFPYPNSDFDTVWKPAKNIMLIIGNAIANRN